MASTSARVGPSLISLIAYAAPIGAAIALWMPTMSILPGIYAKYFGLKLEAIAEVLLVARVFDGFTDPVIGYLADRYHAKGGSYKPWVMIGGIGMLVAAHFLFSPPRPVSQAYYLVWSLVFYVAWSLIDIPHGAWGATLTGDYYGRARIYGVRSASVFAGLILFFCVPFLPMFSGNEYTPETMRWTVYIGAAVMLACLVLAARAPEGAAATTWKPDSPRAMLHSVVANRPLLIFLTGYVIGGIGYGMWFGLAFIYLDGYLHLADKISIIFLVGNIVGMLSMPAWLWLTRATSKSSTWAVGTIAYVLLLFGCLFITPGSSWLLSLLLTGGIYVSFACQTMATQAILGDVADFGALKFRRDSGATYFALLTLSNKVTSGLGAGLSLGIAGHYGFDVAVKVQTSTGIVGLRLAFIFLPIACAVISIILILLSPITPRRHGVIRRRLETQSA